MWSARAAWMVAAMPDAQSRLMVSPGTVWGSPARAKPSGRVAVVLSRLIRAAHKDITDGSGVEVRVALQQGLQGVGCEVVCPDGRQGTAEVADGRSDAVNEERIHEAAGDGRFPARLRQKSRMGLKTKV